MAPPSDFHFKKIDNRTSRPSGCHLGKKCQPDEQVIRLSIFFQMTTWWGCHPVLMILPVWTGWVCHPVVNFSNFLFSAFVTLTDMGRTRGATSQHEGRRRLTTSIRRGDQVLHLVLRLLVVMLLMLVVSLLVLVVVTLEVFLEDHLMCLF